MDIQNRKDLNVKARRLLSDSEGRKKTVLIYASVIAGATVLAALLQNILGSQISKTGGLSNMGLRSILSTFQSLLPVLLNFLFLALGLGFTNAMLRVSRGQFTSPNSLRMGFSRFWVLLRFTILQGSMYFLAVILSYMLSIQLFLLTPMARKMMMLLAPALQSGDIMTVLQNPAVLQQMTSSMIPLYGIMIVVALALCAPIYYRHILTRYILIENPSFGAMLSMRISRECMRKKGMQFFKLDLSLWPYYLLTVLSTLTAMVPAFLSLIQAELPISGTLLSLLCSGGSILLTFLTALLLQPHMEVVHALAYDALRPRQDSSGGAVLGNIFDLARQQMQEENHSENP